MSNPAESLADLRDRVATDVRALLTTASFHFASDTELADSIALGGDILRFAEALLVEGVAELAERSRSLSRDTRPAGPRHPPT